GTYTVCITDANGCSTCDTISVAFGNGVFDPSSGMHGLSVYPNPFSSETTVELTGFTGSAEVKIFDVIGNQVRTMVIHNSDRFTVTREDMGAGMYFMEVLSDGALIGAGKLIVTQ
ncbi:MAG TPA: T9SS type A sorting domain-containing protein, partial [Bacteroidia bacterium]